MFIGWPRLLSLLVKLVGANTQTVAHKLVNLTLMTFKDDLFDLGLMAHSLQLLALFDLSLLVGSPIALATQFI